MPCPPAFSRRPSPDPQMGLLSLHSLGLSVLTQLLSGWFCLPSARKHKVLLRTPLRLSSSKDEVGSFTCQSTEMGLKTEGNRACTRDGSTEHWKDKCCFSSQETSSNVFSLLVPKSPILFISPGNCQLHTIVNIFLCNPKMHFYPELRILTTKIQ